MLSVQKQLCASGNKTVKYRTLDIIDPSFFESKINFLTSCTLKEIYRESYEYKKTGVILTHIISETNYMHDLFDPRDREKQKRISQMIDSINQKNGTNCIKLAAQGVGKADWNLRRDFLSKCPSTKMGDIIEVRV